VSLSSPIAPTCWRAERGARSVRRGRSLAPPRSPPRLHAAPARVGPRRARATQAVVDDAYLGYVGVPELLALLGESLAAASAPNGAATAPLGVYRALVAECLACRAPGIVDVGLAQLALAPEAWTCPRVLAEALAVGQDPDCRGQARPAGAPQQAHMCPVSAGYATLARVLCQARTCPCVVVPA
jgi:hypothetical protein